MCTSKLAQTSRQRKLARQSANLWLHLLERGPLPLNQHGFKHAKKVLGLTRCEVYQAVADLESRGEAFVSHVRGVPVVAGMDVVLK